AFPLRNGGEILGVLEFFSREVRRPDRNVLDMMVSIGSQIGQLIERRQAEKALHEREKEFAVARVIQERLLPGAAPARAGFALAGDMSECRFVTLLLTRLHPLTRSLVYAGAGHWPGYVLDAQGEVRALLPSTAIPLGLDPAGDIASEPALTLEPGDLVLMLTDG